MRRICFGECLVAVCLDASLQRLFIHEVLSHQGKILTIHSNRTTHVE